MNSVAAERVLQQPCKRRSILKTAAGFVAATQLGGSAGSPPIYREELADLQAAAVPFTRNTTVPRQIPRHEQVIVPTNPRFSEQLGRTVTRAFAVVHPGYIIDEAQGLQKAFSGRHRSWLSESDDPMDKYYYSWTGEQKAQAEERDILNHVAGYFKGRFGDYQAYLDKMAALFEKLQHVDEPVIVFSMARDLYADTARHPEFLPPDNAFIVATQNNSAEPMRLVGYQDRGRPVFAEQAFGELLGWLGRCGVGRIEIAGEKGVHGDTGSLACVGGATEFFMQADRPFTVQGMQSLVFPTQPDVIPGPDRGENTHKAAYAMYIDAVPAP